MDIRLGTDLVYIPRIHDAVEQFGDRFLQRIDTCSEQEACGVGLITDTWPAWSTPLLGLPGGSLLRSFSA